MEKETTRVKLNELEKDSMNYTTYVFEILDNDEIVRLGQRYIMCVKYPNWNQYPINIGDKGYVTVLEVMAGIDKYYNGVDFIPYNYTNVQFIKFVKQSEQINKEIKL